MDLLQLAEGTVEIRPDMSIADTIARMSQRMINVAAVIDDGRIAGIVTEHDLKRQAAELGPDAATSCVRDVMLPPVETIPASTPVLEAANIMRARHIRTLGLTDGQGSYVGLVTLRRVLYEVMDELDLKVDNLERELMADGPGG
jgi:arabinose-5-phosphate isomerase